MASVVGYVNLTFKFSREKGQWVGICEELGTGTFGKNIERVTADLRTLVSDHLNLLEESGERVRFFHEHGIVQHSVKPTVYEINMPVPDVDAGGPYFQPSIFTLPGLAVPA